MDQRNASGGESTGPIPVDDPWGAFADDQLGLMDHLGTRQFFFMGYCIGGPFAMKLMERAPQRVVAAVLCQPVGHRPENPDYMYNSGKNVWAKEFRERRADVPMETIEKYLHNLYRLRPDFVYSVSRDFARTCQTPMLVLPDDVAAHPLQTSIDIASLCPNAEITVFPWKAPPELKARFPEGASNGVGAPARLTGGLPIAKVPGGGRSQKSEVPVFRGAAAVGFS
jgi:pimeloyl-ACP methyl ester carboxylesterase